MASANGEKTAATNTVSIAAIAATVALVLGLSNISTADLVYGQPTTTQQMKMTVLQLKRLLYQMLVPCLYINHTK